MLLHPVPSQTFHIYSKLARFSVTCHFLPVLLWRLSSHVTWLRFLTMTPRHVIPLPHRCLRAFNRREKQQERSGFIPLNHRFVCASTAPSLPLSPALYPSPSLSCREALSHVFTSSDWQIPKLRLIKSSSTSHGPCLRHHWMGPGEEGQTYLRQRFSPRDQLENNTDRVGFKCVWSPA